MPDVVGMPLDSALESMEQVGEDDVEVTGGGVFGVVDEGNWVVCDQNPAPGGTLEESPILAVDRECDDADTSAQPGSSATEATETEQPSESESSAEEASEEPLTPENSTELAAFLVGPECDASVAEFAEDFEGALIAFDGSIIGLTPHQGATTRFDVRVAAEEYSENAGAIGPFLRFEDVSAGDLGFTNDNPDGSGNFGEGDNVSVVARIDHFDDNVCAFELEPVSMTFRTAD